MLTTLMALSGSDILGGAGQLEVATAVSPLQLIIDNEIFAMARHQVAGFTLDEDQLAWEVLVKTEPGQHFLMSEHTLKHCRDGFRSGLFLSRTRDEWERKGKKGLLDDALETYRSLTSAGNVCLLDKKKTVKIDAICDAADSQLVK